MLRPKKLTEIMMNEQQSYQSKDRHVEFKKVAVTADGGQRRGGRNANK
jgi:hypothetical protein